MKKNHQHHFININKIHLIYAICDFVLVVAFVAMSFLSKFSSDIVESDNPYFIFMIVYTLSIALITVLVFHVLRIYRLLTKTFSLTSAIYIALVTFIIQFIGFIALFVFQVVTREPRISFWSWALSAICLCGILPSIRLAPRIFTLIKSYTNNKDKIPTIVIGGGQCGKLLIDEMRNNPHSRNKIVAILDDDEKKIGSFLSRIEIVGQVSDVEKYVERYNAEEVIVAISDLSEERNKEINHYLEKCNVRVRRMTSLNDTSGPNDVHSFKVDIDELLYRESVKLDNSSISDLVGGSTVLVTGAGGSIGSELVRQLFDAKPKQLILFDIYENSNYEIEQELKTKIRQDNIKDVSIITLIGSTYNLERVEQIIKQYRPDFIYHAAAYKHVPLMENSPQEAIRTNVIGTYNVAKMADKYHVKKMVLVSTDKAVRPTNVMGATKRFAEMVMQHFSLISNNTIYACVRFGNVLGSNGSVIPLFKKQIEKGGPVTITDTNIVRYFMSIPEAVSLILQCSLFATKGEIFILDMGQPIKIIDLAEKMIRQAGLVPYKDINIITVGLRPGEKLYEELLLDKTKHIKTSNDKIYVEHDESHEDIESEITLISKAFSLDDNLEIKKLLAKIINTYTIDKR